MPQAESHTFSDVYPKVLSEITSVLTNVDNREIDIFADQIVGAHRIIVHGAGRVGMAIRGFAMRLGHLGFRAHTLGDSTVPNIAKGDLLIIASGSGETQTIFDIAQLGKRNYAGLALITGNKLSRIGLIADTVIVMKSASSTNPINGVRSMQPMTTLNEQCLSILFDATVLILMAKTEQNGADLWLRHSNLE